MWQALIQGPGLHKTLNINKSICFRIKQIREVGN
jgi:hypothetical protein